jgi:hypothetical protein
VAERALEHRLRRAAGGEDDVAVLDRAERHAAAEVLGEEDLRVGLEHVHLADLVRLRRREALVAADGELRGDARMVNVAPGVVDVRVRALDGPLVRLVALVEGVPRAPLVGEQSAVEEHALVAARRLVELPERADAQRLGAGQRADVLGVDDVGIRDVQDGVRRARGEQRGRGQGVKPEPPGPRRAKMTGHGSLVPGLSRLRSRR